MSTLRLLRVFCAEDGSGGNPLGVFLDGSEVAPELRQAVAADLGLSEVVFVDDAERGEIRIFTPAVELDFAGHPSVGTAWLLDGVDALNVPAGELAVRRDGDIVYVAARPEWGPPHELIQLSSADEVEALEGPPDGHDLAMAWAWLDEGAGTVRARVFPVRIGIAEDEATGSAATKLCALLGRPIDIRQGRGSRILARPGDDGFVEIGGLSVEDDVRDYELRS
ncbi:MAG TPA: PhzF family phenazine biosynthesis protein [Thermoleophilaceae bacterium]|nr:PhzF family phenazine biosynthesis protein [Thermoleophilaceae bacterium]